MPGVSYLFVNIESLLKDGQAGDDGQTGGWLWVCGCIVGLNETYPEREA